jgi:hypothetical protein
MKLSRLVLGTTIAVSLLASAGTMAAAAAPLATPPANCQGSFNPYSYTRAALSACSIPTYPESTSSLSGGGALYSYTGPNGLYSQTIMPPAGFDPTTATAAQLAEYAYPPRPADPQGMALWDEIVSIPRTTPEPFMPVMSGFSAALTNSHWSGYLTAGGGFTYAEDGYVEPTYNNTVCPNSASVTWAGLGGGPNAAAGSLLVQTGTAHSSGSTHIGLSNHQPWWEVAIQGSASYAQPFTNSADANAGDTMVAVADTQSDSGSVVFDVYDITTSQTWQAIEPLNGRTPNPATAEIITERPDVNNAGYPDLSDFGNVINFATLAAQNGLANYLYLDSPTAINMTSGGTTLATPGAIVTGYADTWDNCS